MWFFWDGQRVLFSHATLRQKYLNPLRNGRISFHVQDPDSPYCTLEVRRQVESMDPDPEAAFYRSLQEQYGLVMPVFDADVRVIIAVKPTNYVAVDGGLTESETVALTVLLTGLGNEEQPEDLEVLLPTQLP
jgi:hypothetical protein